MHGALPASPGVGWVVGIRAKTASSSALASTSQYQYSGMRKPISQYEMKWLSILVGYQRCESFARFIFAASHFPAARMCGSNLGSRQNDWQATQLNDP